MLGSLALALYFIKRLKFRLNVPSKSGNLLVVDQVDIGDGVKALLLEANGQRFLSVVNRNSCSNLCPVKSDVNGNIYNENL